MSDSLRKTGPLDSISHAWRALRHRNFRLFFVGQGISVIGTWMTRLATGWLVYRLTHSALLLGVVSFAGQIVPFLLGPLAGVWVERMERRRLLVWTQAAACVQSFAMAALTLAGVINLWEVIALACFQGLINAFDTPARQSFLVQMVEGREDLSNAIALNSSLVNGARLVGPALAGIVIAAVGEGWCFFIDGVSYFAVIASLLMMRIKPLNIRLSRGGTRAQLREGWVYVRTSTALRNVLVLLAIASFMGFPYMVLLPIFAAQVLHGGAHTFGWLAGAAGLGALTSALSLAARKSVRGLTGMLPTSAGVLGVALIFFGFSQTLWISLLVLLFVGFGLMQVVSASNTIIQSLVPDDKRARVLSYYATTIFGTVPLGSLFAGAIAHKIGAPKAIEITGIGCILAALWFLSKLPDVSAHALEVYDAAEAAAEADAETAAY